MKADYKENHKLQQSWRRFSPRRISIHFPCSICKKSTQRSHLVLAHFIDLSIMRLLEGYLSLYNTWRTQTPTYAICRINTYLTITIDVQVILTLLDMPRPQTRFWIVLAGHQFSSKKKVMSIVVDVAIAVWHIHKDWKRASYYILCTGYDLSGLCIYGVSFNIPPTDFSLP